MTKKVEHILKDLLKQAREAYPQVTFMWSKHIHLGNYVLYYKFPKEANMTDCEYDHFESLLEKKLNLTSKANEVFDAEVYWLSLQEDDSNVIEEGLDIIDYNVTVTKHIIPTEKPTPLTQSLANTFITNRFERVM